MAGPVCRGCGQENPEGARFCVACGAAFAAPAVAQERKVVTAVFVDLVGFTELAERRDPEDVAPVLAAFWERARSELERRGGTVEKFVGDAVLALFGAPAAHEDDPVRAVRAALAIRDWARGDAAVDVRIGLATGEALVRLDAAALAGEGTAVGDVVNTAARLQQAAPVDGVLVDAATFEATSDCFELRAVTPVAAKGKARPVEAWEAVAPRPRGAAVSSTPFVGRASELALLRALLARAADQHAPQLVTVVGPPGIGKTRLVRELRASTPWAEWMVGRALPYDEGGGPLAALAEAVRRYLGVVDQAGPAVVEATVGGMLASLDLEVVAPHVRALLGLRGAAQDVRDTRTERFAAWRRLLETVAARQPLVLGLEDVQWADRPLLDFVDHLLEWAVGSPLLVLCTARPELLELHPEWAAGKPNALTLTLGPLSDAETGELLAHLLGCEAGAELRERAGGNPLYAEQFAHMVGEQGDALDVPRTVHAVIGARIDALAPDEKQLLEDAAVVGEYFWPGAVDGEGAADVLHRLERKDLIRRRRRSTVAGEVEYAFRHALVCDVAYDRVTRARRAQQHRRVAEWLASAEGDQAERLAHHSVRALEAARAAGASTEQLEARARDALAAAGDRALSLNAFDAAIDHLRAAVELCPRGGGDRPGLLLRLGQALWIGRSQGEAELQEARDALHDAGEPERQAEAETLLCELRWYRGDLARSWQHLDAAASLVEDAPPSPVKAYVLARLARQLMLGGSYERAIAVGREALDLAERLDLDELRSSTLNSIGSARARAGDPEGIHDVERAAAISLGAMSHAAVVAYNNLASLHGELGDLTTSGDYLARARSLAEELGNRSYLEWSDRELAARGLQEGRWDDVVAGARRLDANGGGEPHYLDGVLRCAHALVLQARGDPAWTAEAARGEEAARRVGDPQILLSCLGDRALLALLDGRGDEAEGYADEVVQLARSTDYLPSGASYALAVVLAARGRGDELPSLLDGFPQRSRWFDAARAVVRGDHGGAADLYGLIGDRLAEAYCRVQAGDPRGAAFYEAVGARAPAVAATS